jgi:4-amino-4-deoxy-L-arabinose transferase-like glycosyltransferase
VKYSFQRGESSNTTEKILGLCSLVVFAGSLFFPLMDKDAAHHANIALHMHQTGDYFSLIDRDREYLDKPHFLFWTTALGFKLFGISTFACRFPAILFALISVYSTYKLSKYLSGATTARMAAFMLASAQAFILSVNDARMETPLTAGIIFSIWQLVLFVDNRRTMHIVLAALGVAAAFMTKGWLGPIVVFAAVGFRILFMKQWRVFGSYKTWLFVPLFFIFISPSLYAYYFQFDLHPEKVIRGQDHVSGVKFILWGQLFERYKGFDVGGRNSSPLFLVHTFLWAFLPWCLAAYMALFYWLQRMVLKKKWNHPVNFAAAAFLFVLAAVSVSKFKMPHYIIMLLPLAAVFTAPYLKHILVFNRWNKFWLVLHIIFAVVSVIALAALNYYFFKPVNIFILLSGPALVLAMIWLIKTNRYPNQQKVFYIGVAASLLFNFFLNYNFFPALMKFQAGNEMVKKMKQEKINIPDEEIYLLESNAHSFDFYRRYWHPVYNFEQPDPLRENYEGKYFLMNKEIKKELELRGFTIKPAVMQPDYNVARVKLKFLNEKTRYQLVDTLYLARIEK